MQERGNKCTCGIEHEAVAAFPLVEGPPGVTQQRNTRSANHSTSSVLDDVPKKTTALSEASSAAPTGVGEMGRGSLRRGSENGA